MKRLILFLGLVLTLFGVGLPTAAHAQRAPLVLAFYYDWFDENTWAPAKVPDMPVTPYVSRDAGVIARQIQQARGAGIDAFVVSWWGAGNPTDDNLATILDQARTANFKAAVDFELTSPFYNSKDDVIRSLKNLLATRAQHPAYLRVDGKPVIFFWREQKYSVDEWRAIRDEVDPYRQSLWIAEGIKEQLPYLSVFDGLHLYSIGWAPDVAVELQKWNPRVKAYGAEKIWTATVMPGNDDTRTHRPDSYIRDRQGGNFYRETWRAAFTTNPDWIIITSWNEWVEGTMIEPSVSYGNLYLDITREFAGQFKAGLPSPTPTPTKTVKPTATATLTATSIPTSTPTSIPLFVYTGEGGMRATIFEAVRVRAEPNFDAAILGRLSEGAQVTLLARTADALWWQIAVSAKQRGWIASEFARPEDDINLLPVIAPSATPTATQSATPEATPTSDSSPTASIETATSTPIATPTRVMATPTTAPAVSIPLLKSIFRFLP